MRQIQHYHEEEECTLLSSTPEMQQVCDQLFKRDFWKKRLTHKTKEKYIKRITTLISFGTLALILTKCRIESRVKLFQPQFLSHWQSNIGC